MQTQSLIKNRHNFHIDSIKGVLIFLVVFGHVVFQTEQIYNSRLISATISWIWFFHMPAFAMISGYLTNTNKHIKQHIKSCSHILITYLLMQTILTIIYGPRDIETFFCTPQYAMWYLPALAIWRISGLKLFTIIKNDYIIILLAISIALLSGFLPTSILGFQRICSFFPFFILGMLFKKHNIKLMFERKYKWKAWFLLSLIFLLFLLLNKSFYTGMCNAPYKSISQLFSRSSVLLIGTIMSFCFFTIIPSTKSLSYIGRNSLFIYCYHVFFILNLVPQIWNYLNIKPNFLLIILYTLISFCILLLLSKIKVLRTILTPFK